MDAKLLSRSLLDALLDVLYVHADPQRPKEFLELLMLEMAVDAYEELAFHAERCGESLSSFVNRNPNLRPIVEHYEKVQEHPAFANKGSREKRGATKRLKEIRISEKLKAIKDFDRALKPFTFTIRSLANAHAHHRPAGLMPFFYMRKDGTRGVRTCPRPDKFMYSADWASFEASLCLLVLCDQVTSMFFLGQTLERRTRRILDRLNALAAKKPASKMLPVKPMRL
jgi:hypothetical protein